MQASIFLGGLASFAIMIRERRQSAIPDLRPLVGTTRMLVWVTCLLSPVWSGIVYYYGWHKRLPMMAKQANRITFIAIIPWLLYFGYFILIPSFQAGM